MARSPAAANGGWPGPRHPAEPDPRNGRAAPQGQRPAQPAGYPQGGYPEHQAGGPGYDPQQAYHYPQNGQAAPAQPNPRQGLSSLESAGQSAPQYQTYPAANQPPYGQPPAAQNGYRQAPAPYGAPAHPQTLPDPRAAAAGYEQWQVGAPSQDPHGYDLGSYLPTGAPQQGGMPIHAEPAHLDPLQQQPEWGPATHLGYGDVGAQRDPYAGGQMGYEPTHGGALEQSYAQEEGGDYDIEEPRRGSWVLRIAGAIVVAIGLGYGLAQGYKLVSNPAPEGAPPVVKGDSEPSKTKPTDPGGKQFAHADSKIMGRLGEGGPTAVTTTTTTNADSDVDANGARKVQTLVVGRDGSISPPAAPEQPVTTGAVEVPGLTVVDGYGGGFPQSPPASAPKTASQTEPTEARQPIVVRPPAPDVKPVVVKATVPKAETPASEPSPAPKKTAALAPTTSHAANGYVVVLASVPASSGSRLAALRKFADMQEKYGSVLQNKTPDVQEANLGAKGTYHRLVVGPPGSRAQASTLCSNLKAAGYKDCWVMAY